MNKELSIAAKNYIKEQIENLMYDNQGDEELVAECQNYIQIIEEDIDYVQGDKE